ncbi:hypothetical protein PG990_008619 [Apiospora arundinis]
MFTKIINLALLWAFLCCALAAFAVRSNDTAEAPAITWKLAIEEGGPIMEFNGTLQQVEKQIQAIKPDFKFTPVAPSNQTDSPLDRWRQCLGKPGDKNAADPDSIWEGIKYLNGLGNIMCGSPGGSDGTNCGQISCSWNSAIKWCNLGPDYYETACSSFTRYAQDILDNCQFNDGDSVHGQEWDTTSEHNFVVVVEHGKC